MREKNPLNGIYYSLGPHDLFPADYQYLNYIAADTTVKAIAAKALLTNMDAAINTDDTKDGKASSISKNTDARTKFKEHGYYK